MTRSRRIAAGAALIVVVAGLAAIGSRSSPTPARPAYPAEDTRYVSRRCVTRLWLRPTGFVGQTTGGLLTRDFDGNWSVGDPASIPPAPTIQCQSGPIEVKPAGLSVSGRTMGFPAGSCGTHLSAGCAEPDGQAVLCAVWGDDTFYRCDPTAAEGARWTREPTGLPVSVGAQITAIVKTAGVLCVGTRREGIWERALPSGDWRPVALTQAGPYNDDAEAVCTYKGAVYISTLEDGLDVLDSNGWRRISTPAISTDAPRQMVVFNGALYVRHGDGVVDRFNGTDWTRDIWVGQLPHKQVSALAVAGAALYAAQWGGWSVWNGATWTHRLKEPDLEGTAVTALLPDRDGATLWIGTQGKGLIEADIRTGAIRQRHDERIGIPDDWITCLAQSGDTLYAGTFVGGLAARREGAARWVVAEGTAGENVTDIAVTPSGVIAATRHGVREIDAGAALPETVTSHAVEAQALCPDGSGLWVGTRTGIQFVAGRGRR